MESESGGQELPPECKLWTVFMEQPLVLPGSANYCGGNKCRELILYLLPSNDISSSFSLLVFAGSIEDTRLPCVPLSVSSTSPVQIVHAVSKLSSNFFQLFLEFQFSSKIFLFCYRFLICSLHSMS